MDLNGVQGGGDLGPKPPCVHREKPRGEVGLGGAEEPQAEEGGTGRSLSQLPAAGD